MAVLVRTDLDMGKGKIAAQVAHAAVSLVLEIVQKRSKAEWKEWLEMWINQGQPKIVLKVKNLDELLEKYNKALQSGLPATIIQDAGKTQIEPGTITCAGIGPGPEEMIDNITGDLKLL
ncbi:conserved Archaeal protein [Sulfolobus acidocaldarius DSM 639]|nr:conserved Archaeal protein [Sulfolobus acidocaldarius DSM 639]